jgi:hypothetical protein
MKNWSCSRQAHVVYLKKVLGVCLANMIAMIIEYSEYEYSEYVFGVLVCVFFGICQCRKEYTFCTPSAQKTVRMCTLFFLCIFFSRGVRNCFLVYSTRSTPVLRVLFIGLYFFALNTTHFFKSWPLQKQSAQIWKYIPLQNRNTYPQILS